MRKVICVHGQKMQLRPISAYDAVRGASLSKKTALRLKKLYDGDMSELCDGACIAHLSLFRGGKRAYSSPLTVMRKLSVEEIIRVRENYLDMMEKQGENS